MLADLGNATDRAVHLFAQTRLDLVHVALDERPQIDDPAAQGGSGRSQIKVNRSLIHETCLVALISKRSALASRLRAANWPHAAAVSSPRGVRMYTGKSALRTRF